MSLNLFGKTYLAPDYLYDNAYNRIVFSQERNQVEYLNYDSFNFPGLDAEVIHTSSSVLDVIGSGQFETITHYLKHLHDTDADARIFADDASWFLIFFTWLKISFPNITNDSAFILYNISKQRESLVFPDDREFKSFMLSRLNSRNQRSVLTKQEFIDKFVEFNSLDTTASEFYEEVRVSLRNDLCIEIQLASYLAGVSNIDVISEKIKRIGSKIIFKIVDDIRDYIRENIMTEKVKSLTGVNLSWEDQNWESTLASQSSNMNFLFNYSSDSLINDYNYRITNKDSAISWCQWLCDNTTIEDQNNPDLSDIISASEWVVNHQNCLSSNNEVSQSAAETLIQEDISFVGTTLAFQQEYTRDRINTFWIEYIYQMATTNDINGLRKISHT